MVDEELKELTLRMKVKLKRVGMVCNRVDILQKIESIEAAVDDEDEAALSEIENTVEEVFSSDEYWMYVYAIARRYRKGLVCKSLAYKYNGDDNNETQRLLDKAQTFFLKAEQVKQECLGVFD